MPPPNPDGPNADGSDPISRISRGDRTAVTPLLERYLPALTAWIGRRASPSVRSRETPEDLAQSVCRDLLERLADGRYEFRDEPSFRSWLYRAALLKVLNRHRHWNTAGRDAGHGDGVEFAPADTATPSAHLVALEELDALERSFSQLPERYREVIALSYVERLPHGEIAARLGITPGNSRVLLSRALAALARLGAELD